jgi:alpha-D-xyloside xylohydrolase
MSSHSRLHGSTSYRVPWAFDEEAVDVTRRFSRLKLGLMPYLHQVGIEAHETGIPFMRPMQLEFPDDPSVQHLDRQYMLGSDLLVAPVFRADGEVEYLLPAGTWTNLLTGEVRAGGGWHREVHDVMSMPIWVREGAVLATTERVDRPDHDHLDGLIVTVHPGGTGTRTARVTSPTTGRRVDVRVVHGQDGVEVTADPDVPLRVRLHGGPLTSLTDGKVTLSHV